MLEYSTKSQGLYPGFIQSFLRQTPTEQGFGPMKIVGHWKGKTADQRNFHKNVTLISVLIFFIKICGFLRGKGGRMLRGHQPVVSQACVCVCVRARALPLFPPPPSLLATVFVNNIYPVFEML